MLTFGLFAKDHPSYHPATLDTSSEHLDDPDGIDVEIFRRGGHDGQGSLCDEL